MSELPDWVEETSEDVERLIVELAEEGHSPSEIGIILRDKYAIPDIRRTTGKKVTEILESHDALPDLPSDLMNLIEKAVNLHDHMERNPKDVRTQRSLDQLESRIKKLTKYYQNEGTLPPDWRYDRDRASLLVRG